MAETMRSAILAAPGRFEVQALPLPRPGPNQVRVRLEGCGICGSNLPPFEGRDWFRYPFAAGAPGHEGWGVVEALGEGVQGVQVGTRVAAISGNAYAECDLMDADALVTLPPALADRPFPGEPLGCAMNVFRRSDIQPGQTVAVVGVGFLGAVITRLAANAGAKVIAVSRRRFALELAERMGAWRTVAFDDRSLEVVKDLTHGDLCDRVVEAVGLQAPLDLAGELTRERGRLMIAGYHQDGPRQVNLQLWNWRGLDVINAHERDPKVYVEGMRLVLEEIAQGRLDPTPLYTHRFRLDEINQAFAAVKGRPDGFLKALVTP
jgi:threonine dehydrogenase-like Zn-dependent dehydrogenase